MAAGQKIFVVCSLSKGAFSGERVFEIQTVDGHKYEGVASKNHCVSTQEPNGKPVSGKVAAIMLGNQNNRALISVPDGEVIEVSPSITSVR